MKEKIRKFVEETLRRNNITTEICDDDSLILSNIFDSLDVVDLQLYIEGIYGIPPAALADDLSRIDTINKIVNYISENVKHYTQ